MKYITKLIYLLIQFHYKDLILMEILFSGSVGLLTMSWLFFFLTIVIVFVVEVIYQHERHKKGII